MRNFISVSMLTFIFCFCISIFSVDAATINASSCSKADVETAITAASTGDTIVIPSGTCSWVSAVEIPSGKSITIAGQTTTSRNATTYQVTATDNTIIQASSSAFRVNESNNVRIAGITFDGATIAIVMPSPAIGMRIDHCHFISVSRIFDKAVTPTYKGILFDHNRIYEPANETLYITGAGNTPWIDGGPCGSSDPEKMTIFEDNEFVWSATGGAGGPIDSGNGAMIVFRHNRFTGHVNNGPGELLETHGHCWGQRDGNDNAATYCMEISNNKFYKGNTVNNSAMILKSRGGISYVYNNEIYDAGWSTNAMIRYWTQEVSYNCNSTPCAVQAHEDMGLHAVPLSRASNYTNGLCDTYPCPMQVNNSYIWGNTWDSGTIVVDDDWYNAAGYVDEDRDYWDDLGAGDTNFSSGLSAARPGNCADDDCYWETDTKKLYRCVGANNWTLVYTSYTYPHPLTKPSPPRNLRISQP